MSVLLPAFPRPLQQLVADPARVGDTATELLAASARLDDTGELARGEALLTGWEGEAAESYRHDLAPDRERADAMSLALRRVGQRVEDHAQALGRLLAELDDLTADNQVLVDDVFAHGDAVRAFEAGVTVDPDVARAEALLRARSDELAARVRALDLRQDDWWDRVVAEEDAVLDVLAAVLEPSQVEHHHGGEEDPADDALRCFPGRGAAPLAVLAWWRGLTELQRRAVLVAAPGAVGDLDGIPAADRDRANRLRLSRDLATLRHLDDLGRLTHRERGTLDNAEAVEEALERHADDTDAHGRPVPTLLWVYDPGAFVQADGDVDGRVAVAVGYPDAADSTAVTVPGVGTDAGDVGLHTDRAWELHQAATAADPDRSYSAIAWLGYDAPPEVAGKADLEAAASAAAAARGGALLAASLDGLRAVGGDGAEIVPVGHSYGSVTLGATLSQHDVDVDRAVVVGSPGLGEGVDGVGDLDLPRGGLYVGQGDDDLVAGLGQNGALGLGGAGHGQDPADDGFGATRFQANAGPGHDGHSAYFDNDSESLHNLGLVLAGQEPTPAGAVHDPWWGPALDPEDAAPSDVYDTDGDGDTDGVPSR